MHSSYGSLHRKKRKRDSEMVGGVEDEDGKRDDGGHEMVESIM